MAYYKLFQLNTGAPASTTIQSNTLEVYSNNSGVLLSVVSGGNPFVVGRYETGIIANSRVVTGLNLVGFSGWIPFIGPSGQTWVVPAYGYT